MRRYFLLLAAVLLGCASQKVEAPVPTLVTVPSAPLLPGPGPAPSPPTLRLPEVARPTSYAVQLTLVPSEARFQGVIEIHLDAREPLSLLWLNAQDLTISKASATVGGSTFSARTLPQPKDFVGLAFEKPLPQGESTLRLEYSGPLPARESNGVTRQQVGQDWYVFSHFEPIDARRAFPCFDEPSYKAPWQLSIKVKSSDVAFTNTALDSKVEGGDGFVTYRFRPTLPLPSYLVSFAAGPLERVDAGTAGRNATPMGVIVPRGMAAQARWAVEVSGPLLARLEEYFGIPYPYGKMDVIAVPYFGGAMEHPGLVTYSLPGILSRKENETISWRRRYAETITHEFAHQWFGDYVTTAWWDDLWLNEAFATWMTPKVIEAWQPTWGMAEQRVLTQGMAATVDSLVTARRIRQSIVSNDDIQNAFDGITYSKGAAVISMFEKWVGPEKFQKGVQRYMREHANGNATAAQFLAAISAEAGKDVAPAFSSFLDQPGVPLVTVALRCDAGAPPRLLLSQQRYLPQGSQPPPEAAGQRWLFPICMRYGKGPEEGRACTLLEQPTGTLDLPGKECPDWVLPNDGFSGYYRASAEGPLFQKLLMQAKLTAPERLGVLNDVSALVRAGKLPLGEVLTYLAPFAKDSNRYVVQASLSLAGGLREQYLVSAGTRAAYGAYLRGLYGQRARALGFTEKPGEDEDTRLLRVRLVPLVADEGEDAVLVSEARTLAERWLADKKAVSADLLRPVLDVAAAYGDRAFFDKLVEAARQEPLQAERLKLFGALGSFRSQELSNAALGLLLEDTFDVRETFFPLLFGPLGNVETRSLPYAFVRNNYEKLVSRLPRDWGGRMASVGSALCDDEHQAEVASFFGAHASRFTGGPRNLAQSLENMRLCSTYRKAQAPSVEAFLRASAVKGGRVGSR